MPVVKCEYIMHNYTLKTCL